MCLNPKSFRFGRKKPFIVFYLTQGIGAILAGLMFIIPSSSFLCIFPALLTHFSERRFTFDSSNSIRNVEQSWKLRRVLYCVLVHSRNLPHRHSVYTFEFRSFFMLCKIAEPRVTECVTFGHESEALLHLYFFFW